MYWIVRAKWTEGSQIDRFISKGIWESGYSGKYINVVNKVKENEIFLLANSSYIEYYAICK